MYVFEFTDNQIIIYNKKKKEIIKEIIPENIIVNNKIYDYFKFIDILNKIVNKYKIINSIFRIKVKIILFESWSPSELYVLRNAFKSICNFKMEVININRYFDNNSIFVSGSIIYYNNKKIIKLNKGEYVLIGNSDNYINIVNQLINKYHIKILEYENSNTIIYEKV